MKFAVGYQLTGNDRFLGEIIRWKEKIGEVYFSWGGLANGRHAADTVADLSPWEARERTVGELAVLAKAGIPFNLLLNGNCYGGDALSKPFFNTVCDTVDEVGERFGCLVSVTTTSPVLAHLIKVNFPDLEVRASVNMEIGTRVGVEYLAADFDGFYLARELNRDLPALKALAEYCRSIGKKVAILTNSGCLSHCPARQFHDNLVAHEREIMARDNAVAFRGVCDGFLRENPSAFLSRLNFIRPEDLPLYEGIVDLFKLATRVNPAPETVLRAYAEGRYAGNLPELLEPDHAARLYPAVIENKALPPDFGERVSHCGGVCRSGGNCDYCHAAYLGAVRTLSDDVTVDGGTSNDPSGPDPEKG